MRSISTIQVLRTSSACVGEGSPFGEFARWVHEAPSQPSRAKARGQLAGGRTSRTPTQVTTAGPTLLPRGASYLPTNRAVASVPANNAFLTSRQQTSCRSARPIGRLANQQRTTVRERNREHPPAEGGGSHRASVAERGGAVAIRLRRPGSESESAGPAMGRTVLGPRTARPWRLSCQRDGPRARAPSMHSEGAETLG